GTPIDVSALAHGQTTTPSSGATGTPSGLDLAVGIFVTANTLSTRTFSPALTTQTDEPIQTRGVGDNNVGISDGPISSAVAETFSGTCTFSTWSAWSLLIAGAPVGSGNSEHVALTCAISASAAVAATNTEAVALTEASTPSAAI